MQEKHSEVIIIVPTADAALAFRTKCPKLQNDAGHLVAKASGSGVPLFEITVHTNEKSRSRNMIYAVVSNVIDENANEALLRFLFTFLVAAFPLSGVSVRNKDEDVSEFVQQAPGGSFIPDVPSSA